MLDLATAAHILQFVTVQREQARSLQEQPVRVCLFATYRPAFQVVLVQALLFHWLAVVVLMIEQQAITQRLQQAFFKQPQRLLLVVTERI